MMRRDTRMLNTTPGYGYYPAIGAVYADAQQIELDQPPRAIEEYHLTTVEPEIRPVKPYRWHWIILALAAVTIFLISR